MNYFLLIMLSFISLNSFSQENCPCCTEPYRQFDFWVGDWNVFDTLGNKIGGNSIIALEDGCIINEHWIGAKGGTGRSYNYYNKTDSTWSQLWIDNSGNHLELKGNYQSGKMVLQSAYFPGKNVKEYANRISWEAKEDGSVHQIWDIIDINSKLLQTAFYGIYQKKE